MLNTLRPYQRDIVNRAVKSDVSTLIQLPTGGGKTIIAKEIVIDLINKYNKKILFVAPKKVLMQQIMDEFKGLRPQLVHGNHKYDKNHNISVSTIQTASRRDLNPDVIIVDEIHHGYDGKMIEKLIKDKHNTRTIGLSATPYDKNGRLLQGFTLILDQYDIRYMIDNGYLVPIKSYALKRLDLDNVKITAGDYNIQQLGEVVCNKDTILEIVDTTKPYIDSCKKTIVFAVNIEHAKLLANAYNNIGCKARALHSKLTTEEIRKEIESFRHGHNDIKVLVSVLMLTTGFDVPDIDCAVIARPTKSQNLYKQMVGRILRTAPNKKEAILLDCGNVIDNLGDPLDQIKIREENNDNRLSVSHCDLCNSENLQLKKSENEAYWLCLDCGFKKKIEKNAYKCLYCKKVFDETNELIIKENSLYIKCICEKYTLISKLTGNETLVQVGDSLNITNTKYINANDFITELLNEQERIYKSTRLTLDSIRQKRDSSDDDYSTSLDMIKKDYSETFKKLKKCIDTKQPKDVITLLENDVKKHKVSLKELFNNFQIWNIIEDNYTYMDDWKIKLCEEFKEDKDINVITYFIDQKYMSISKVLELMQENKLYKAINFLIDVYGIKRFDFYLDFEDDYIYNSNVYHSIDSLKEFLQQLNKNINYFDIPKSLHFNSYFDYCETSEEHDELLVSLIDYTMYIEMILNQFDIKALAYEKEISFKYDSFHNARDYVQSKGLDSFQKWEEDIKSINRNVAVPRFPNLVYPEWKSWENWFGKAVTINFNNQNDLHVLYSDEIFEKYPLLIDNDLKHKIYSMYKTIQSVQKSTNEPQNDNTEYWSYEKAKQWVHKLNLKNKVEWKKYCQGGFKQKPKLPLFIPKEPHIYYRGKGWKNTEEWIGSSSDITVDLLQDVVSIKKELLKPLLTYTDDNRVDQLKQSIENNFLKIEAQINDKELTKNNIESLEQKINNLKKFFITKVELYK